MDHFQIYRLDRGQWVLIRTRLETVEKAREVMLEVSASTPGFKHRICKVSTVVVDEV